MFISNYSNNNINSNNNSNSNNNQKVKINHLKFNKSRSLFYIFILFLIFFLFLFISYIQNTINNKNNQNNNNLKNNLRRNNKEFPSYIVKRYDHLVIVPGHAVMILSEINNAKESEGAWYLLDYQLGQGFPDIINSHIEKGIEIAATDTKSILIFSGGQTRQEVGPFSEAASYYYYAKQYNLFPHGFDRVHLEEYARDSFENVLFSICRFHEITGVYPDKITVVGFDFKSRRYVDLIRRAVKFPENSFDYIGIQPNLQYFQYQHAIEGENAVYNSLSQDIYGCNTQQLSQKRLDRDPYQRTIPYSLSCQELNNLLNWCESTVYPGYLPWCNRVSSC